MKFKLNWNDKMSLTKVLATTGDFIQVDFVNAKDRSMGTLIDRCTNTSNWCLLEQFILCY